jgi:hypothetical protein
MSERRTRVENTMILRNQGLEVTFSSPRRRVILALQSKVLWLFSLRSLGCQSLG